MNDRHDKPLRIGLTGGIASGKSTVADMFADLGVPVIDTDVIAREVVRPGEPALEEIREAFGDSVIAADGTLVATPFAETDVLVGGHRGLLGIAVHPQVGTHGGG